MKETLEITVPGTPISWARAGRNGRRTFTPKKQKDHMRIIQGIAALTMGANRGLWWETAVTIEVVSYFKPSASWSKIKKASALAGTYAHTKKPDGDNLVKLVKDALSGVVYRDDALVVDSISRKRFGETERTVITIKPFFSD